MTSRARPHPAGPEGAIATDACSEPPRGIAATLSAELDAIVEAAAAELDARTDQILEKRRWILDRRGEP
jgi:hypothetical protein